MLGPRHCSLSRRQQRSRRYRADHGVIHRYGAVIAVDAAPKLGDVLLQGAVRHRHGAAIVVYAAAIAHIARGAVVRKAAVRHGQGAGIVVYASAVPVHRDQVIEQDAVRHRQGAGVIDAGAAGCQISVRDSQAVQGGGHTAVDQEHTPHIIGIDRHLRSQHRAVNGHVLNERQRPRGQKNGAPRQA